jgi:hypothetical protein
MLPSEIGKIGLDCHSMNSVFFILGPPHRIVNYNRMANVATFRQKMWSTSNSDKVRATKKVRKSATGDWTSRVQCRLVKSRCLGLSEVSALHSRPVFGLLKLPALCQGE